MRKKILIIEDDIEILSIFEIILEEEGYELSMHRTGVSVLEVSAFNPDLILLDVRIEGYAKTGAEICADYKSSEALAHVPMLLVSSEHNLDILAAGCHADGYLNKPFEIIGLLNKIKEFIN